MSTAASIALLVLAIELLLLFGAILVGVIVAGVSVVESTAVTRMFLRRQAKGAANLEQRIGGVVTDAMTRLTAAERYAAWVTTFVESIKREDDDDSR
ncbi:MAG: hypothetical protein OXG11_14505 [Chloroflexi bacterium]|nr:hypothetical protein [Chloroflexota bacterium]